MKSSEHLKVDCLARIEGEAGFGVVVREGKVVSSRLHVFEPPRLFEAFLRGRSFQEVPDITARICGICPVAYQLTAVQAIESAFGVEVNEAIRALRELLYCGEWIESHSLHVFLLHAPDFLGYEDALSMAKEHPDPVRLGLELKRTGNELVALIGGREVHPINVRVGGFHGLPARSGLNAMADKLQRARDLAVEAMRWIAKLPFPDFQRDYDCVALQSNGEGEYPICQGEIVSTSGLRLRPEDFETVFLEDQFEHSHALHSTIRGQTSYLVGPLARHAHSSGKLSPSARDALQEVGLGATCGNLFKSILVRCAEIIHACETAVELIRAYEPPPLPSTNLKPAAGSGCGCTEAPRGLLYHRYVLDEEGIVQEARIVPPTAQNLNSMEEDLAHLVSSNSHLDDIQLTRLCEQAIRNYDPCISCATHLVNV